MQSVNELLSQRLKKNGSAKMSAMAERSVNGQLSTFSGLFQLSELTAAEKQILETILRTNLLDGETFRKQDLESLIFITAEVKAISNQAALLHGERIKRAQKLLKNYRDGAFTSWLISCYGNRQTPYNLLQYYEFYELLPKMLQSKIESMPRQAIYTLASRKGAIETKQKLIENYQGETKEKLLLKIRELFPLESSDRRRSNFGEKLIKDLKRFNRILASKENKLTKTQKKILLELIHEIYSYLGV